jgi:DNA-binding NtrC family response regulator
MDNLSNAWQIPVRHPASSTYGTVRSVASVQQSLRGIIQEMRTLRVSYEDAVCEFRKRYIIGVLIVHACHMGKTARELGMHRNTLSRTIIELKIDIKQIRSGLRTCANGKPRRAGIFQMEQS